MKYVVYLDESRITNSRYSSISAVSLPACEWPHVVEDLASLIDSFNVHDLKWEKVRNRKYRDAAISIFQRVTEKYVSHGMRIDSICWDNQDSRHAIAGRDDLKNFERMFYHLLCASMRKREAGSVWGVYPDQLSGVDWETSQKCINAAGRKVSSQQQLSLGTDLHSRFQIRRFSEANSIEKPITQIADLFAGMAAFSVLYYEKYSVWLQENHPVQDLFSVPGEHVYSNSENCKFTAMETFKGYCTANKLGVSLSSSCGFQTMNPENQINFWRYQPQHVEDKAPIKSSANSC
jgi:hypothetical protein